MSTIPSEIDGRRFLRALARFGWRVKSQTGSHRKLVHDFENKLLIVAFHDTVSGITIRKTLRQAGIDEDEFLKKI